MQQKKSTPKLSPEKLKSLIIITSGCTMAGILWGLIYAYLGLYISMIPPFVFSIFVGISLLVYRFFQTESLLANMQILMILVIPTILQWTLGGFHKSGVVILWSTIAPFGAIIFQNNMKAILWTLAYGVLLAISFYFDSDFQKLQTIEISSGANLFFYGMNIVGTSLLTFSAVFYYNSSLLTEQEKRDQHLELLNQNVDLLLQSIEKIAAGDLTGKIEINTEDSGEFKRLFHGYNHALDLMQSLLNDLESTSINVTDSIVKISSSLTTLEEKVNLYSTNFNAVESHLQTLERVMQDIHSSILQSRNISDKNLALAGDGEKILYSSVTKIEAVTSSFQETDEMVKQLERISLEKFLIARTFLP